MKILGSLVLKWLVFSTVVKSAVMHCVGKVQGSCGVHAQCEVTSKVADIKLN